MGLKEAGVAGAVAMSISQVTTQPGDVLKTIVGSPWPIFQSFVTNVSVQDGITYRAAGGLVLRQDGVRGFWRGSIPTFYRGIVGGGLFFPALELMRLITRPLLKSGGKEIPVGTAAAVSFINGIGARAVAEFISCPLFVVKTEIEYGRGSKSVPVALRNIYLAEGLRGLFKGVGPAISRGAVFAGTYIALYDWAKLALVASLRDSSAYSIATYSALFASTLGTILTHPFDVVRTHMQLSFERISSVTVTRRILSTHGVRGLMAGLAAKLVKRQMTYSLMFPIYEVIAVFLVANQPVGGQSVVGEN